METVSGANDVAPAALASPKRVLWVTFDFPPRLSSGVFRPVKIYKYVDKRRLAIDFITHGAASRFQHSLVDDSLLAEVTPPPRVVRVRTPVLHDALPALISGLRSRLRRGRVPSSAPSASAVVPPPTVKSAEERSTRTGLFGAFYRRLAMCLYFPDHLFLWGHLSSVTALWMHWRNRYDVVYTTSYPESAHLPGFVLHALGVPWVVDYRYGGPLWIRKLVGFDKPPLRMRLDLFFQRTAMRMADRVITQSEPMRRDFCRVFGLDPDKVEVIASGYDDEDFTTASRAASPFARNAHDLHLLHVGVMEGITDAERRQLAAALSALSDSLRGHGRRLVVHAVGRPLFDDVTIGAARFAYQFHGTVMHQHLPPYLLAADCYLLSTLTTSTGHDEVRGFIPGKVWEYLRAGKPILMVGPQDEIWSIISEAGVGLHMRLDQQPPLAPEMLLQAVEQERPLHPKVRSYSWESRARSLQQVFLYVTGAAATPRRGEARA